MTSRKKSRTKKHIVFPTWSWSLAAFLIPFVSCIVILALKDVYPFGNQCILQSDMRDQYCPFFYDFARKLKSGNLSLYNWNMGLGAEYVSTYSYYLSSPLNFLLFFVPEKYIIEFMTYSIVFRIGISGFCFYRFLRYRFDIHEDDSTKIDIAAVALFLSTAYALSGYIAAYNWQIMWLDCVALAPLIFLGLLKMYREKKFMLYYVTLAIAIFSNYYIAMMICIFLVFYWLLLVVEEKDRSKRIQFTLRFAACSVLAGGTSAVLILPTVSALSNSGSDVGTFPTAISWYYSPLVALARGNAFAKVYAGSQYWPNIYAGVLSLILVLVYFFTKEIAWKKKIPRIIMLLFLQISFINNVLSYIWHGFRYPTWFPSRQSFLYIFLLLTIAMEGYLHINSVKTKQLLGALGLLAFLVFLSAFAEDKYITGWFSFRITGVLIFAYAILYFLSNVVDSENKIFLQRIILVVSFAEVILGMNSVSFYTTNREEYVTRIEDMQELLDLCEDGDFYRTDAPRNEMRNDASLLGYPSLSVFNTILNIKVADYYDNQNMMYYDKYYTSGGITPVISAMLGARYQISKGEEFESELRTLVGNVGEYYLYENQYYLPLGFAVPANVVDQATDNLQYGFNDLPMEFTGKEAYSLTYNFTQTNKESNADITVVEGFYTRLTIEEDGYYYIESKSPGIKEMKIVSPNGGERIFYDMDYSSWIELGYAHKGDMFIISNPDDIGMIFDMYKTDLGVVEETINMLGKHTFVLNGDVTTSIEGSITVGEGEKVVFSIPADKGWKAYVDGEEIAVESYQDAFLCIGPKAGEHTIRLVFEVPYLRLGIVLSVICVGLMLVLFSMDYIVMRRTKCN